jgi:hypothetical protein
LQCVRLEGMGMTLLLVLHGASSGVVVVPQPKFTDLFATYYMDERVSVTYADPRFEVRRQEERKESD